MGNDVEMRERGFGQKQKSKSVEKGLGRNIQVLGKERVCCVTSLLLRPRGGVVMVDADADPYTDSFALVYPLQLVSFSPRPGLAARATKRQVWPPLGGCFHARQGTTRRLVQSVERG